MEEIIMAQDPKCIFCRIVRDELPATKVYEDEEFVAFLDKYPRTTGHCQIVPKDHFRWVWDVPHIGRLMEIAQKVANAQRKAFGTDMIVSHIIGDEVPHAHIWLVPQGHTENEKVSAEAAAKAIKKNL